MQPDKLENEPVSAVPQNLLDRCLVDGDAAVLSSGRRRRRKALGISFAIETAALALLIVVPILTSVAQPKLSQPAPGVYLFGPRHQPVGEVRPHAPHPAIRDDNTIRYDVGQVLQPRNPMMEGGGGPQNIDSYVSGEEQPDLGGPAIGNIQLPSLPPQTTIRKPDDNRPVKLSEGVVQAQMISRIEPRYPPLAQQIKLQGAVVLHAIISRDGNITALDVLSGHPLLVKAALDAVRQWRYRPTLLNGEPVEVETTITVIFRLQQ